ncbi:flagellar hook assembly protein FlgD [Chromobacterium piscinae]|uniref:Basal-body rod modification protein FlgD n=1 Tax=Chromobacterium piscinae TaxID=686831 RepID=A0ABV0HC72_9NEIS|nr:flagellar hook capping FlgD N-terminal domain-containing protein [Chromobacterium piscinae]MBX9299321.1 flagellar hook capping protein [Chromobacterium vaccinii]MBX9350007.1 flagellar hook capping protein [Chromobacterium vaccinii]MBX9357447.1 flagellar hook capping protein [Chromobacterium vaccinii]MCD5329858.1 flagellar hook capping protein [Chromobacterium piscinae]NHQ80493.1 flagellar hook capping protein [Chromobacterium vaccinii]
MATAATNGIGNGFDYTNVNSGQVPPGSIQSTNNAGTKSSNSSVTSAQAMQNNFLTLLTAQLNAQDPLNPMDNSQITSQMAQISQVAGLQTLNQTMQQMVSAQSATQSLMASSMIGKNVMVAGNALTAPAAGQTTQAGVLLNGPAASVQVNVLDQNGNVVDTVPLQNLGKGLTTFSWDGKDANNNQLPAGGSYTFQVKVAQASSSGTTTATAYNTQQVQAVSWANGSPMLVLPGNNLVPLSNVAQMS